MTALRINNFGGIIPRLAPRVLTGQSAQAAGNVSLLPGELRPMRKPKFMYTTTAGAAVLSFYKVDDSTWFTWSTANVNMERTAIEGETRYAYTGDGVPKITTKALGAPVTSTGLPAAARTLGIPAPQAQPSLAAVGGAGATSTRYYCYTFYSDWNEEGINSPISALVTGKVDSTWNVTGMDDAPPNTGSVTAATYSTGVVTLTSGSGNHYLRAGDQITISGITGMTDANGTWTVASVPANNQITIALTTAQTYTAGGTWTRVNPWGTCKKRIYRTTGTIGQFQLVATGVTGTSYADTIVDALIPGDALISQTWAPPPVNMIGMASMPGGILCGFISGGRTICFTEAYQPHAWPTKYQIKANDDIVGIASFDTNLGVATKGFSLVLSGSDPSQMSVVRHAKPFPCLSRSSVCGTGDGVVFATKNGLVRMDQSGVTLFTEQLFTPEGWNQLTPASMTCGFDGFRLHLYSASNTRFYIMNLVDGGAMVNAYQPIDCVLCDRSTGDFYFAFAGSVYRFDSFDTAPMTVDWWSKEFLISAPGNIGAAKVEFDPIYSADAATALAADRATALAANALLMAAVQGGRSSRNTVPWNKRAFNASNLKVLPSLTVSLTFSFYANGVLVYNANVVDQRAFRLPSGYKVDTFSVRVQSNTQVRAIVIGSTAKELVSV